MSSSTINIDAIPLPFFSVWDKDQCLPALRRAIHLRKRSFNGCQKLHIVHRFLKKRLGPRHPQNMFGLCRFADNTGDPASACQGLRFFEVCCAVENYWNLFGELHAPELLNQLIAIHMGHQDIRDDEFGCFRGNTRDSFLPVGCFQQTMAFVSEKRCQNAAVQRIVIDHKNGSHFYAPFFPSRHCSSSESNNAGSIGREINFFAPCTRARSCSRTDQTEDDRKTNGIFESLASACTMRINS